MQSSSQTVLAERVLDIDRKEMREMWQHLVDCIHSAVDFIRKKISVSASRLLPYSSLLVPFSYFFFKNGFRSPDGRQSDRLQRYFYINGFAERLASGTQSKLTEDIHIIDELVAGNSEPFDERLSVSDEDIRSTKLQVGSAYCKSILCLLAAQCPRDLRDASDIILGNQALRQANSRHFHHIFPKAYLLKGKPSAEEVNSIANIALVPADLNRQISAQAPSIYLDSYRRDNESWDDTLRSHMIMDDTREALENNDFPRFLQKRAESLSRLANDVLSAK